MHTLNKIFSFFFNLLVNKTKQTTLLNKGKTKKVTNFLNLHTKTFKTLIVKQKK